MRWLVEIVVINSLTAGLLAVLAAILARWIRRPAILHALWLLVLLKLVTPPVVPVEALPVLDAGAGRPASAATGVAVALEDAGRSVAPPPPAVERKTLADQTTIGRVAGGAWIGGSLLLVGLVVVRYARFRRLIADSVPAPPPLRRRTEWLAERMGLRRCPTVRLVGGRLPPLLWWRPGPGVLFLPDGLLRRLDGAELDALIVHELAHVRRRDHWVRWIEMSAIVLFWWNPVTWWARRNLRIAEEKSCDAWVLELLPGRSRSYAEGILKTVDYINEARSGIPILATGAAETRHLKERLTMIMSQKKPLRTLPSQRWALAALALALLLVYPTPSTGPAAAATEEEAAPQESHRRALIELEQEALELEYRLNRLRIQRMEIEREIEREIARTNAEAMRRRSEELRFAGREDEAIAIEHELAELERRREIEADLAQAEMEQQARMRSTEFDLQRASLALEEARLAGDPARAEALERAVRELELEMRHAHLEELRRREHLEKESLSALELESRARMLEREAEQQERYEQLDKLAAELTAKLEAVERAEADAEGIEAEKLRQAAAELRRALEQLHRERGRSGVR